MTAVQRFYVILVKVDRLHPWCNLSTYHGISGRNRFFIECPAAKRFDRKFYHFMISECPFHGNLILWLFRTADLFPPHCRKHLIKNNGLIDSSIEILVHETIFFSSRNAVLVNIVLTTLFYSSNIVSTFSAANSDISF